MTRKDYALIAEALRNAKPEPTWCANKHAQHRVDIHRIACALGRDNPKFDRERFEKAAGAAVATL